MNNLGDIVKVKLKQIDGRFDSTTWLHRIKKTISPYGWGGLENSIIKKGYDTEKYGFIKVIPSRDKSGNYEILDGNHRVEVLKKIYGEDEDIWVELPEIKSDEADTFKDLQIIYLPTMLFFIYYALLPLICISIILYMVLVWVKDIKYRVETDVHPLKGLTWLHNINNYLYDMVIMLHYNAQSILCGILFLVYIVYLFYWYWVEILIFTFFNVILFLIFKFFGIHKKSIKDLWK
tara:strand:+ start:58 stop:759 length:702 start_codon:yes stop_codon:yes gene_type:complete